MFTKEKAIAFILTDLGSEYEGKHVGLILDAWLRKPKLNMSIEEVNAFLFVAQDRPHDFFKNVSEDGRDRILRAVDVLDRPELIVLKGDCENPVASEGLYIV